MNRRKALSYDYLSSLTKSKMKLSFIIFFAVVSCICCYGQSSNETKVDTLYINMNDKLVFEVEVDSTNHLSFKKADANTSSSKTITIALTFTQGAGTFLKIQNPFSKELSYKAELYAYKKKEYLETSTVPIEPKIGSFETWPYKIDKMRLSGFTLKNAD